MILPDFIVGGAPRCGTTWLWQLLASHPEVYMARPAAPEPKFFLVDEQFEQGLAHYSRTYFAAAAGFRAVGEKSTNYLESLAAAQRIRRCLPHVRLVFILRNPIERAFSNYLWSRRNGLETLSFEEALAQEADREAAYPASLRYARPFSYLSRGFYARLLAPYLELFPPAHIHLLLLDDVVARPAQAARALFAFLGVAPPDPPGGPSGRVNSARDGLDRLRPRTHEFLRQAYLEPNRALARLVGRDLSSWDRPWGTRP